MIPLVSKGCQPRKIRNSALRKTAKHCGIMRRQIVPSAQETHGHNVDYREFDSRGKLSFSAPMPELVLRATGREG
jgi:hypothetical protein